MVQSVRLAVPELNTPLEEAPLTVQSVRVRLPVPELNTPPP